MMRHRRLLHSRTGISSLLIVIATLGVGRGLGDDRDQKPEQAGVSRSRSRPTSRATRRPAGILPTNRHGESNGLMTKTRRCSNCFKRVSTNRWCGRR